MSRTPAYLAAVMNYLRLQNKATPAHVVRRPKQNDPYSPRPQDRVGFHHTVCRSKIKSPRPAKVQQPKGKESTVHFHKLGFAERQNMFYGHIDK